jgi:hypothetical protein
VQSGSRGSFGDKLRFGIPFAYPGLQEREVFGSRGDPVPGNGSPPSSRRLVKYQLFETAFWALPISA